MVVLVIEKTTYTQYNWGIMEEVLFMRKGCHIEDLIEPETPKALAPEAQKESLEG